MGGRIRLMLTGGAPLSPETQDYIQICLCVDVIQGYALTETTSGGTVVDREYSNVIFSDFHVTFMNISHIIECRERFKFGPCGCSVVIV